MGPRPFSEFFTWWHCKPHIIGNNTMNWFLWEVLRTPKVITEKVSLGQGTQIAEELHLFTCMKIVLVPCLTGWGLGGIFQYNLHILLRSSESDVRGWWAQVVEGFLQLRIRLRLAVSQVPQKVPLEVGGQVVEGFLQLRITLCLAVLQVPQDEALGAWLYIHFLWVSRKWR